VIIRKLLKDKTALVIGASGDIGLAISKELISNGAKVILHSKKGNTKFKKFCKINSANILEVIKFDLLESDYMQKIIKKRLYDKKYKINFLINSAGFASGSIFEMTSISDIKKMFDINFFSQLRLIQLVLRLMKNSKNASIINIGSISGIVPYRGNLSYGTSKSAIMFATKILSKELAMYKIRVNAVAPGVVSSKMADMMDGQVRVKMINQSTLKREIKPSEVAKKIAYLCSDEAIKVNGQVLKIDNNL
jgi:3-oxoacyl-[acyl-carrier protein] reductase